MMTIRDSNLCTQIDVELNEGLNVIIDDSGTGKTYLMSIIQSYCVAHNINMLLVNSSNYEACDPSTKFDLILLDNADLYASREFLSKCCSLAPYVLCSAKTLLDVENATMYLCKLENSNGVLEVRHYDTYF